jgi:hypothetical protein
MTWPGSLRLNRKQAAALALAIAAPLAAGAGLIALIPADVRFSWLSRLRYYRCECGRTS